MSCAIINKFPSAWSGTIGIGILQSFFVRSLFTVHPCLGISINVFTIFFSVHSWWSMKDSLHLGFWVANIIVNNGIGNSIITQCKQISTQQETIDGDPYVETPPFSPCRWIVPWFILSQLNSRERNSKSQMRKCHWNPGRWMPDKFNLLLLLWPWMMQTAILFNTYCTRGFLRREIFETPSAHVL